MEHLPTTSLPDLRWYLLYTKITYTQDELTSCLEASINQSKTLKHATSLFLAGSRRCRSEFRTSDIPIMSTQVNQKTVSFLLSVKQSNFYSANIPSEARLSGVTAESVFNSKIEETFPWHQQAIGHAGIYEGKAKSKRCVFRCFLKVATEMAKRTDSRRLFQRDGTQEWKALAAVLVLTLGTDKLLSLFDLSDGYYSCPYTNFNWAGSNWETRVDAHLWSKHWHWWTGCPS